MIIKRNPNTIKLTKSYIESKISQELIVSKYLNIPLDIVKNCINTNTLIKSVFRNDDDNYSMGIQYNNKGRLKVRDFGGFGFFEDIYGVVAYVLSLMYNRRIDCNNKQDFYFILQHIATTFANIINNENIDSNINNDIQNAINKGKQSRPIIDIVTRNWNKYDKDIWEHWGINLQYLNTHFVVPVEQYYINRTVDSKPKYSYICRDPCYAYLLGQTLEGINLIKLYFPKRNRKINPKFITNCNILEGLPNIELNNYDYIILTKSSKDRLSIGCTLSTCLSLYRDINVGILNLPSENYKLKQNEYDWIKSKLNNNGIIISLLILNV